MPKLVIHAPSNKVKDGAKSFETVLQENSGDGYAIAQRLVDQIPLVCGVVVLDKDKRKRAEGLLEALVPQDKTLSGMQRYEVRIRGLHTVAYKPEKLNRCGVALIE